MTLTKLDVGKFAFIDGCPSQWISKYFLLIILYDETSVQL
jgi:hypothetical protein